MVFGDPEWPQQPFHSSEHEPNAAPVPAQPDVLQTSQPPVFVAKRLHTHTPSVLHAHDTRKECNPKPHGRQKRRLDTRPSQVQPRVRERPSSAQPLESPRSRPANQSRPHSESPADEAPRSVDTAALRLGAQSKRFVTAASESVQQLVAEPAQSAQRT